MNREALGQGLEVHGIGSRWGAARLCLCRANGSPHRAGHCKGETSGSELEHKRYLIQHFSFFLERYILSGKLEVSSPSCGEPKKKTNIHFNSDDLHYFKVFEERVLLKCITDTENNDGIKPWEHISCKLIVLEAKGKVILEIAFGNSYSRCKYIEHIFWALCLIDEFQIFCSLWFFHTTHNVSFQQFILSSVLFVDTLLQKLLVLKHAEHILGKQRIERIRCGN